MAKFKSDPNAHYEIRRSPEVRSAVDDLASMLASRAGPGFTWSSQQGERRPSGRWRAIVFPETVEAMRRNARDNVLVRALGGGGG